MLTFERGNIFDKDVDAMVNPVNCMGVMGKGLALEFKRRFPEMFAAYRDLCHWRCVRLGRVDAVLSGASSPPYIVLFPTKNDWKEKSAMWAIRQGLHDMDLKCWAVGIRSVAVPALGCGLGGLPWNDVRTAMEDALAKSKLQYIVIPPIDLQANI